MFYINLQAKVDFFTTHSFTPCFIWYLFYFSKLRLTDKCVSVSHSRNTHSVAAGWHGDFRQRYVVVQLKVINRIVFHVFDTTVPFKQRLFLVAIYTSVQTCLLSNWNKIQQYCIILQNISASSILENRTLDNLGMIKKIFRYCNDLCKNMNSDCYCSDKLNLLDVSAMKI